MKIVIDFDNTIFDSVKRVLMLWNEVNPGRKVKIPKDIKWDFVNCIEGTDVTTEELLSMFEREDFYDVDMCFEKAKEIINELCKDNEVIICTKHTEKRKPITERYIKDNFPLCKIMYVDNFEDKQKIQCDIIIDDKPECLGINNNRLNVLYGLYDWNKPWYRLGVCFDWEDVDNVFKALGLYTE